MKRLAIVDALTMAFACVWLFTAAALLSDFRNTDGFG